MGQSLIFLQFFKGGNSMKKLFIVPVLLLAVVVVYGRDVMAHETHQYRIGDKTYEFVVGSLNEPVSVDDKSGVDLRVREIMEEDAEAEDDHGVTEGAVEGLNQTLKVEVSAGTQKKVFDLSPVFGAVGSYKTTFYPTLQTTLSYRFFGRLNETPINLTFTCNPAGHPQSAEDKTEVAVSDGVARILKRGAFGCPVSKASLGFPEPSASVHDLASEDQAGDAALADFGATSRNYNIFTLAVAGLALLLAVGAYMRSPSGTAELPR
jgi:hypothetical protein